MDIEDLHLQACIKKEHTYIDPNTGYMVFTSEYLLSKNKCCGKKCRHCPYNWINVKPKPS